MPLTTRPTTGSTARPTTRHAPSAAHVRSVALLTVGLAVGLATGAAAATATAASAEPPASLAEEVTDTAGVLSPEEVATVTARLGELADATPYQLFVVYVDSFDGMTAADWADETAVRSGLGRDDLLLAVAVDDRQYQVSVDPEIAITDAQLDDVEADRIEPALRTDDWAGAAVAAADGYQAAAERGSGVRVPWGVVGAVVTAVALVVAVVVVVGRRRSAAAARAELDALDGEASSALVAVDEAVTTSAQELGFAEAQLGAAVTAPFAAALEAARGELAAAFAARQRLDDSDPESDDERRALLTQILEACTRVDAALDAQTAEFDRLRDLHARAPQLLADAGQRADALAPRADSAAAVLAGLAARYAPSALAAVARNADDARELLVLARTRASEGTGTLETDRAASVAAAQEAAAAIAQATALLDAVDATAQELAQAPDRVAQACADLESDLGDAARLGGPDPVVRQAADHARTVLGLARSSAAATDPVRALDETRAAERALDQVLDPLREAEAARARAAERLPQARAEADTQLASASALLTAHRDAVGSTARTRLAEARRYADQSAALLGSDPVAALRAVETASRLAVEAHRLADQDVDAERSRRAAQWSTAGTVGSGWSGSGWGGSGWGGSGGAWGGSGGGRRSTSSSRRSSGRSSGRSSSTRRSSAGRSRRGGGGRF